MNGTEVDSFMVRFAKENDPEVGSQAVAWYGFIRHVQSDQQLRFTRIEDALNFMAGFVDINVRPVSSMKGEKHAFER